MPKSKFGDIGPCEVVWDYGGTPLNLSPFLGTVELRLTDSIVNVEEEAYGDTAVDAVFSGSEAMLDCPLTRQDYDNLANVLPGVELQSGSLIFSMFTGCDMYENAKEMAIKPVCDGVPTADTTKWVHIWKAYPYRDFALTFDRSGQRVIMVHFKLFPDLTSGAGGRVFRWGIPV